MKHTVIENHIDSKIISRISDGLTLKQTLDFISENIEKFSKKENYVDKFDREYILKNWNCLELTKKYTTYYVIWSKKRLNDLIWLIENRDKFDKLDDSKLFKLLKFKESLKHQNKKRKHVTS